MPRHIIFKLWKIKNKAKHPAEARGEKNTLPVEQQKITSDFSSETMQVRREWSASFKVLRGKCYQPRILYPEQLSFKSEGEIKQFLRQTKIRGICCR